MKILTSILFSLLVISCATTKTAIVDVDTRSLISQQNSELGLLGQQQLKFKMAFQAKGSLTQSITEKEIGHLVLNIDFEGVDNANTQILRTFSVDLDEAVDFPEVIHEAKVLFLANHLVVTNLDDKSQINYFVKTDAQTKNLIPQLPPVEAIGIGMAWEN